MFSERTQILSGIQLSERSFEFVFMETNQLFGSNVNVIFLRQTSGLRLSMASGSKYRALAFYFTVRIVYLFLISKCRAECGLGLRMSLGLANRMLSRNGDFRLKMCLTAQFVGSHHYATVLDSTQNPCWFENKGIPRVCQGVPTPAFL